MIGSHKNEWKENNCKIVWGMKFPILGAKMSIIVGLVA